jgi:hypothetical protein
MPGYIIWLWLAEGQMCFSRHRLPGLASQPFLAAGGQRSMTTTPAADGGCKKVLYLKGLEGAHSTTITHTGFSVPAVRRLGLALWR